MFCCQRQQSPQPPTPFPHFLNSGCLNLKTLDAFRDDVLQATIWAVSSLNKRAAADSSWKVTSPLKVLIPPSDTKRWHFRGFNHLSLLPQGHFLVPKGVREAFLDWDPSYQVELQLWSVTTDGYQYFLWSKSSVGRKLPPAEGRYLLPSFGLSSCAEHISAAADWFRVEV